MLKKNSIFAVILNTKQAFDSIFMSDRITYFSNYDWSLWYYLPRVESILRSFENNVIISDINEVIELYHVTLFIDNGIFADSWTESDVNEFKQKSIAIKGVVCKHFNQFTGLEVPEIYDQLDYNYQTTFWEIISKYKLWDLIDNDLLAKILNENENVIYQVLHYKGIVEHYNVVLTQYFKSHPKTAEILLSAFIGKDMSNNQNSIYYIPHTLTLADKERIIDNYIDAADPNPNYLNLILQITSKDRSNLKVSPKIKIKAQKVATKISDEFFKEKNTGIKYGISVQISQEKGIPPVKIEMSKSSLLLEYVYSEEYILSCSGIKHLENFLHLFGFLQKHALISFVFHSHGATSFFDYLGIRAKNEFPSDNLNFHLGFQTAIMQTAAYMQTLANKGIHLEDCISEFYDNVLLKEYGYNGFKLNIPGHNLSWLEKVRTIIPEIESIIRQYNLYVVEGGIDPDIFMLTDAIKITDCKSLIPKKYIYLTDSTEQRPNILYRVLKDFFSKQSMLTYIEPYKEKKYNSLYQLLQEENVEYNNYENYQKQEIDWLINNLYLRKSSDGVLDFVNLKQMNMLHDLYECDVCMYWNYDTDIRSILDDYINNGYLYFESTLLSNQEQDLFSYVFNNERFSNALAYRNKYLHGTHPMNVDPYNVYVISIMMLICLLFKIKYDLQIGFESKQYRSTLSH